MNNKRWYDFDPTIALAVNLLERADETIKFECLEYIIKKAKNLGIKNENDINTDFNFVWQRRADSLSEFHNALEYMKKMDNLTQKEVALEILKMLNN